MGAMFIIQLRTCRIFEMDTNDNESNILFNVLKSGSVINLGKIWIIGRTTEYIGRAKKNTCVGHQTTKH